jgi:predicted aspartyl protease
MSEPRPPALMESRADTAHRAATHSAEVAMQAWLRRSASVVITVLGVTGVSARQGTSGEPVDSPRHLPFALVDESLIVVEGSVGHLSQLRFLIDTGAARTYIDRRVATALGLKAAWSRPLNALDGRGQAEGIVVPSLEFGPIHGGPMSGLMTDLSALSRTERIDALIGLDLLRLASFEIDYRSRRIVFDPPEDLPQEVAFATTTPLLSVDAAIQGRPVRLMVDTAASTVVLFPNRMRSRLPRFRLRGQTMVGNAIGASSARQVDLSAVDLGRTRWPDRALLVDVTAEAYQGFDGVLGALPQVLARVQFDFRRQRLAWME